MVRILHVDPGILAILPKMVPSPSWPCELRPQQAGCDSFKIAQNAQSDETDFAE